MRHLFKYIRRYWLLIIALVIFTYLQVAATLKLPNYMAEIVDKGIIGQDMQAIYHSGALMLAVTLGAAAASVGADTFLSKVMPIIKLTTPRLRKLRLKQTPTRVLTNRLHL